MSALTKAHLSSLAIFAAAAVLYLFPPEIYHFYPQCPVFRYLHVYCPGCGATRALAALLHGQIRAALHYNALAVFLIAPALYCLVKTYVRILCGDSISWPQLSPATINMILFAAFLFAVIRNSSYFAF
jgi:Protein of unknown function (DUF2752)